MYHFISALFAVIKISATHLGDLLVGGGSRSAWLSRPLLHSRLIDRESIILGCLCVGEEITHNLAVGEHRRWCQLNRHRLNQL